MNLTSVVAMLLGMGEAEFRALLEAGREKFPDLGPKIDEILASVDVPGALAAVPPEVQAILRGELHPADDPGDLI